MAKIAIVLNASWNVWNFRLPLLQALERAGHEILVIAPEDEYVGRIPFPCHTIRIQSKSINPFVDALTLYDLLKEFRRNKPDIILLYTIKPNIYGNLAAAFTGLKTISNVAGLGTVFSRSGVVQVLVKWLYRMVLKYPEKVFFQNREDMKLFIREKLVAPHLVEYVPGSGVDLQRFSPKHNLTVDNDSKIHFLLFTRMLWDKGVGEYVEAAHSILDQGYDVEFRLLGFLDADNPGAISEKDMDELTKRQGIDYAGVSDKIEDEISIADCVVLPTYYPEGTPKALLEAAAMAKPIITTDTAGCRDVVDDGSNGFLCKARDAESLAGQMRKILDLPVKEREAMGKAGRRKVVDGYSVDIVIGKYLGAVNEVLSLKS